MGRPGSRPGTGKRAIAHADFHLCALINRLSNQFSRCTAATQLARHGHAEIYSVGLHATAQRCRALFSSGRAGAIDSQMLPQVQLACCYLLSRIPAELLGTPPPNSLSVRERECLRWVSEGKTTGEVAMILGVTANTVNSYLAHAIRKYGASNRAMAIATAIRSGTI